MVLSLSLLVCTLSLKLCIDLHIHINTYFFLIQEKAHSPCLDSLVLATSFVPAPPHRLVVLPSHLAPSRLSFLSIFRVFPLSAVTARALPFIFRNVLIARGLAIKKDEPGTAGVGGRQTLEGFSSQRLLRARNLARKATRFTALFDKRVCCLVQCPSERKIFSVARHNTGIFSVTQYKEKPLATLTFSGRFVQSYKRIDYERPPQRNKGARKRKS